MEEALIELFDRGARFSFSGEAFRTRREIPNEDVIDIDFSRLPISDAEVDLLLPLINLQGISFWNTNITDAAIEKIMPLKHLKRLNLCGTQVTDQSIPKLISMKLDFVDVADTEFSSAGQQQLRDGLPAAEILS